MSDTTDETAHQDKQTPIPQTSAQNAPARWTLEKATLIEKLQVVSDQAGGDQIRMIELLLAENTWLEGERMVSMHRGQSPDFTTIERFLTEDSR